MPALFDLAEVKVLVAEQIEDLDKEIVDLVFEGSSQDRVIRVLSAKSKPSDIGEAMKYMLYAILDNVHPENFKQTTRVRKYDHEPADEYLFEKDSIRWYLKLSIEQENDERSSKQVLLFSFHPQDCDGRTENGKLYKKQEGY